MSEKFIKPYEHFYCPFCINNIVVVFEEGIYFDSCECDRCGMVMIKKER